VKIPERKDDSPEEFRRQQDLLAEQIQRKMDEKFQKELKELLDKENGDG
jgi:hypothetical protein